MDCWISNSLKELKLREDIVFQWIPSHVGIPGNEHADRVAKEALNDDNIYNHSTPVSTHFAHLVEAELASWKASWLNPNRTTLLHKITDDPTICHKTRLKNKRADTILRRLRLECAPLNYYLGRIKKRDSINCDQCAVKETTEHYLLECNKYTTERDTLKGTLQGLRVPLNLQVLVGGPADLSADKRSICTAGVLQYIAGTKRL